MITVRFPWTEISLFDPVDIETPLINAGVPPIAQRTGILLHWYDTASGDWVIEYTPNEEAQYPVDRGDDS